MTYSIGGTTVIASNGTIDWSKMGAVTIYYGTSATRQVANSNIGGLQIGRLQLRRIVARHAYLPTLAFI
jgi:hypothetical protein